VTNDTQVKLHSDLDLQEAIMRALKVAKQRGKRLVIKMHPAESGIEILDYLEEIKKDSVVFVSNANTVDLIQRSSCVVTINSTVGLEALIFKKDLITLGSALYQDFNQERLLKYIHGYLIDGVDVFGNTKIPKDQALQLIEKK
jgi:capsular polysaccharide export protein